MRIFGALFVSFDTAFSKLFLVSIFPKNHKTHIPHVVSIEWNDLGGALTSKSKFALAMGHCEVEFGKRREE